MEGKQVGGCRTTVCSSRLVPGVRLFLCSVEVQSKTRLYSETSSAMLASHDRLMEEVGRREAGMCLSGYFSVLWSCKVRMYLDTCSAKLGVLDLSRMRRVEGRLVGGFRVMFFSNGSQVLGYFFVLWSCKVRFLV